MVGGVKMELFSWAAFVKTGDIEAYLLYKSVSELRNEEGNEEKWRKSEQKALS